MTAAEVPSVDADDESAQPWWKVELDDETVEQLRRLLFGCTASIHPER
jgi:hypothetical protein